MLKKILILAILATLAGCANITAKATFQYPAPAAVVK